MTKAVLQCDWLYSQEGLGNSLILKRHFVIKTNLGITIEKWLLLWKCNEVHRGWGCLQKFKQAPDLMGTGKYRGHSLQVELCVLISQQFRAPPGPRCQQSQARAVRHQQNEVIDIGWLTLQQETLLQKNAAIHSFSRLCCPWGVHYTEL
jgi:hypothetical protein